MNDQEFEEFLNSKATEWVSMGKAMEIYQYLRMSGEEWETWIMTDKLPFGMKSRWGFSG